MMLKELNTDEEPDQSQWLTAFWKGRQATFSRAPRYNEPQPDLPLPVPLRRFPTALPVSALLPVQPLPAQPGPERPAEQEVQGGEKQ